MEHKGNSIKLSMLLKYGLTEVKKLHHRCSKYACANITLPLTFFTRT